MSEKLIAWMKEQREKHGANAFLFQETLNAGDNVYPFKIPIEQIFHMLPDWHLSDGDRSYFNLDKDEAR